MMRDLKSYYDQLYSDGAYSKRFTFKSYQEVTTIIERANWAGKKVLEIGCGEGGLASIIAFHDGDIIAIDYSEEAIKIAKKSYILDNCKFVCCNYKDISDKFDIVVMNGVLEHVEDPYDTLNYIKNNLLLNKDSKIITGSPSFLNVRGYIWMTLQLLFNIPMSLSDVHFLCLFDMEKFVEKLGGKLDYKSCDQDWGHGEGLIIDFEKRLVNALRDAGMKGDIEKLICWLKKTLPYKNYTDFSGANIVYTISFDS
jgi:SAM-dependent methyltransferase